MSDDEANSWEDSLTESDGSAGRDDYYDEEEGNEILKPCPSSRNKRDTFRLNTLYIYLDTCYTLNQIINNNTIRDIRKVV